MKGDALCAARRLAEAARLEHRVITHRIVGPADRWARSKRSRPVIVDGLRFDYKRAACRELGLHPQQLERLLEKGERARYAYAR